MRINRIKKRNLTLKIISFYDLYVFSSLTLKALLLKKSPQYVVFYIISESGRNLKKLLKTYYINPENHD